MIIISDTNILSSMAAGDSLPALTHLFARARIVIPVGVLQELQRGVVSGW